MSPRKSKRKYKGASEPTTTCTRNKKVEVMNDLKTERSGRTPRNLLDPNTLWWHCIQRIPLHNWYIILPKDSLEYDVLAFATGQSRGLICPLLAELGYIFIMEIKSE